MKQGIQPFSQNSSRRRESRKSKKRPFQTILIVVAMIIFGLAFTIAAQAGQGPNAVATQAGPGFTFQGQLQDNGSPVNVSCDIQAGLWDAVSGGAQVGSYSTLQPRQPLTAAPYAQSLLPGAVISGSVGGPANAMLSLSNFDPNGVGLRIFDAGLDGLFIDRAGRNGVYVGSAQQDGFFLCMSGNQTACSPSPTSNGIEIGRVQDNGIYIERAGSDPSGNGDGIYICNAGTSAICQQNSEQDGVEVGTADWSGFSVGNAQNGLYVNNANYAGVNINQSNIGINIGQTTSNGIQMGQIGSTGININQASTGYYIGSTTGSGFSVLGAGTDGLSVVSASDDGVDIGFAQQNGVEVDTSVNAFWAGNASADGLYVQSAGFNGLDVTGSNLAGYFGGAVQITGGCVGCLLANFGVNSGQTPLEPGDVVVLTGSQLSRVDSTPLLLEVARAEGEGAVIGVVMGRAEEVTVEQLRENEIGRRLIPREETAEPGDFVTIVTSGLAPVRLDALSGPLTIGQRLTAAPKGAARPLQTVEVNGITLNESAAILGIVLETVDTDNDGLIWVLVNPM